MSMPISRIASTAAGCTRGAGLVPAEWTSSAGSKDFISPSAIWLRAEFPVHRIRILVGPAASVMSGSPRATGVDAGKHATVPFPIDPKCDIDQGNEHRDFDQRSDHGGESGAMVDAERGDCHGDGEFEIVGRCRKGERGCLRIVGANLVAHPERHEE